MQPLYQTCADPLCRGDLSPDVVRAARRHLAVASERLAVAKSACACNGYSAAASRFRSLADQAWPADVSSEPYIPTPRGRLTLSDLFASALLRINAKTLRGIEPELVYEAEQLLAGLRWYVPAVS